MYYGWSLPKLMTAKLTCFYNKVILDCPCRMIQLLTTDERPYEADRAKMLYDELFIAKFDPTKTQFWQTMHLISFLYFLNASDSVDQDNLYIDMGKIFTEIPSLEDSRSDIICANTKENVKLIRDVNKKLNEHCNIDLLDDDDLVFYDYSICYLSDPAKSFLRPMIKLVCEHYPEYVGIDASYAILSCLSAHAKNQGLSVSDFDVIPKDINNSRLIDDFYVLM